jgi:hypothetical protein
MSLIEADMVTFSTQLANLRSRKFRVYFLRRTHPGFCEVAKRSHTWLGEGCQARTRPCSDRSGLTASLLVHHATVAVAAAVAAAADSSCVPSLAFAKRRGKLGRRGWWIRCEACCNIHRVVCSGSKCFWSSLGARNRRFYFPLSFVFFWVLGLREPSARSSAGCTFIMGNLAVLLCIFRSQRNERLGLCDTGSMSGALWMDKLILKAAPAGLQSIHWLSSMAP